MKDNTIQKEGGMDTALVKVVEDLLAYVDEGEKAPNDVYYMGKLQAAALRILKERCKLQREYFEGCEKLRMPKDKDLTEWDRKTILGASIAAVREQYEYVKGLEELVGQRVELYKLMMKG